MILIGGGLNRPGKLARKIRTMTTVCAVAEYLRLIHNQTNQTTQARESTPNQEGTGESLGKQGREHQIPEQKPSSPKNLSHCRRMRSRNRKKVANQLGRETMERKPTNH
jgi:hypothetical protein